MVISTTLPARLSLSAFRRLTSLCHSSCNYKTRQRSALTSMSTASWGTLGVPPSTTSMCLEVASPASHALFWRIFQFGAPLAHSILGEGLWCPWRYVRVKVSFPVLLQAQPAPACAAAVGSVFLLALFPFPPLAFLPNQKGQSWTGDLWLSWRLLRAALGMVWR